MKHSKKHTDITKQEPFTYLYKKMWKYAGKERKWIIIYTSMFFISNIISLIQPTIFARFLDEIQINGVGDNIKQILTIMSIWGSLSLAFWLFHGPARVIENTISFKIMQNYKEYLISNIIKLNIGWHTDRDSGEIIDKISKATSALHSFSNSTFLIIKIFISIIGTTVAMYLYLPILSLLVPIFVFIGFLLIQQFDKQLIPKYSKLNKMYNKTSGRVFDTISNITSIKALHIEEHTFTRIKKLMWKPSALFKQTNIQNEMKWFASSIVVTSLTLISMTIYIYYVRANIGIVSIGSIGAVYIYLTQLSGVINGFAWRYGAIVRERTNVSNVEDIETFFKSDSLKATSLPSWNRIIIKKMLFRYQDSKKKNHHLQLDFNFSKSEKIALVGESGSGKTTFLKVLHGMYPEASAVIKIGKSFENKTNFTDIDLNSTLVPQEPEIFSASIRENITLGVDIEDESIIEVIKLAKFNGVLSRLPNGLNSVINEKGVNLSGGEKQRLALARALFFSHNKEVVLLDESTSSVDAETEVKIYQNIFKHYANASIIASVHKMNLLKYFDKIVIFDNGKIVDEGTFEQLLSTNKRFKKNWNEYVTEGSNHVI